MNITQVGAREPGVATGLARLTAACVGDGDSIGFLADVTTDELENWWKDRLDAPDVVTWCALDDEDGGEVLGTVSLCTDAPATGRHRAEVTKLLVGRTHRRRGIARALLDTLESAAGDRGLRLLVLDTESDRAGELAYRRLGWSEYGRLDRHAARPDGTLSASTFFAKWLGPDAGPAGDPGTPGQVGASSGGPSARS